jgi:hypothetical protein
MSDDQLVPPPQNFPNPAFPPDQNRDLDPDTAAWWCVGCPYKAIKDQQRGNPASRSTSGAGGFSTNGEYYGVYRKTIYVCTSPAQTFVQKMTQQHSTIGFGFCPFLEEKLALIPDSDAGE